MKIEISQAEKEILAEELLDRIHYLNQKIQEAERFLDTNRTYYQRIIDKLSQKRDCLDNFVTNTLKYQERKPEDILYFNNTGKHENE